MTEVKVQLSEKEIFELAAEFSLDQGELTEYVARKSKRQNAGPWPMRLKWCKEDEAIQALFKRYKYLSPLLNELRLHKAVSADRNSSLGVEAFEENDTEKDYVLIDLSKSRRRIADRIGCSEETVGNYIRGMIQCGLMIPFYKGRKTYYSMGEWGVMPSEQDKKEFVPRKIMWLTKTTSWKLKQFKPSRR